MLTVPFEVRARLAYDGELLGGVSRELATAVQDFYRRRFEQLGVRSGKTGSVTVVQRSNSDLRLNPHYHQLALDGVYTEPADEEAIPEFHPLPYLTSEDVADLLQLARLRILRFLTRQGAAAACYGSAQQRNPTSTDWNPRRAYVSTPQVNADLPLSYEPPAKRQASSDVRHESIHS